MQQKRLAWRLISNIRRRMDQHTIEKVLAGCRRGESKAQRILFETYKGVLFSICLRYASDRSEAQDFLQDAFITIFRDLWQYQQQGSFEGWLKKVTVRTALQHLRKKIPTRQSVNYESMYDDTLFTLPDTEQNQTYILQMVQQLPPGCRTVFNLRCIEAWSHTEIAEALQISESSVRAQYSRACQSLRHMLHRHFEYAV